MNEAEKKLVGALRSGLYKQGNGQLRLDDKFCCLGVACDISGLGTWDDVGSYLTDGGGGVNIAFLPQAVRDQLNWASSTGILILTLPISLSHLNDNGFTFNQIADLIEAGVVKHAS